MSDGDNTGTVVGFSEGDRPTMRYGIAVAVAEFLWFCAIVQAGMIRRPTLLILGAGASVPYGFPTGDTLIEKILGSTREQNGPTRMAIRSAGVEDHSIDKLREALSSMQFLSIDTFLEHRPQFREVGKLAIAAALIPCEDPKALNPQLPNTHWYRQLFNSLFDPQGFSGRKLTVITLNYDRSLEQYLFNTLMRDFELPPAEAERKVRAITFIHLHGSLGRLPWWSGGDNPTEPHEYAPSLGPETLKSGAAGIRIFSDWDSSRMTEFVHGLHEHIAEAEAIGFLGFGYHETVMQRLDIARLLAGKKRKVELFASAYQLPNGRRLSLERTFATNGICVGKPEHGTFEFLHDCGLLFQ